MTEGALDSPDETPTARRAAAIRSAGERGDVRFLAEQVEHLVAAHHRTAGAARVWRVAGGFAASVAIALGGGALALARDAAVDHDRLGAEIAEGDRRDTRIEGVSVEVTAARREAAGTAATLVEVRAALVDVRDELRALRRETAEREHRR